MQCDFAIGLMRLFFALQSVILSISAIAYIGSFIFETSKKTRLRYVSNVLYAVSRWTACLSVLVSATFIVLTMVSVMRMQVI